MDSSKVLERGLAVLAFIAGRPAASLSEVAAGLSISLPAASRALEALRAAGYLARRRPRGVYRLTAKFARLGRDHACDAIVRDAALPLMAAATRAGGWPLLLGKRDGLDLVIAESTGDEARHALSLPGVGEAMPYFMRAAGTVCVAFLADRARARVLEQSAALRKKHGLTMAARQLEILHAQARERGFIAHDPTRNRPAALAVPLLMPDADYGLELIYRPDALPRAAAIKEHLPRLRQIVKAVQAEVQRFQQR